MTKVDFKKEFKELYSAKKEPAFVNVQPLPYLMIDGSGNPNTTPLYSKTIETLYGVSYKTKFMLKKQGIGSEYGVPPLQGLWWAENMKDFSVDKKKDWFWTMMIMQPSWVTKEHLKEAYTAASQKKELLPFDKIRLETYNEGKCAQLMHIGPYAEEGPNIARLHNFIKDNNLKRQGKHHEIYLGDPRRTAPEKLKTIIRQPCA